LLKFQRFGSVIALKPEFEERYIILHKHTFPGVLKRIYDSNIRNYSIYLRDGILFSYYEYIGQKYEEDMQKIGKDKTTQEWWTLTDPMQEPIEARKEGGWWTEIEEIYFFSREASSNICVKRFACVVEEIQIHESDLIIPKSVFSTLSIHKLVLFQEGGHIYLYSEFLNTDSPSEVNDISDSIGHLLSRISFEGQSKQWKNMREIFHTD
jgi:L-rhamnose mutarotase